MKKVKLLSFLFVAFAFGQNIFAQGMTVFDPTNWISGLDRLYATYDEIQNSIKRIQQNYEAMQHAIEQAQSLDWENIEWDGDFDFRDELRQAGTQINKRLTIMRKAEDCFTKKVIKFGKQSFSYADLMTEEGWKGMGAAFETSAENSYKNACDAWVGKLTDKQKATIIRKYGVTPANYYRVKAREAILQAEMTKIIGQAESELQNEELQKNQEQINAVMQKIMQGGTQKQIAQYTALLQKLTLERMDLMKQQQEEALKQQTQIQMLSQADDVKQRTKDKVKDSLAADKKFKNENNFLNAPIEAEKTSDSKIPGL